MPLLAALAALVPLSAAQYPGATAVPAEFAAGFRAITIDDAKAWLGYLAGPECEGRGSGQDGYLKAAAFMAERYKQFGLKPAGDNGTYFQYVPYIRATINSATLSADGFSVAQGEQLVAAGFYENKSLQGQVAILTAQGRDVKFDPSPLKGKIVITQMNGVTTEFRRQIEQSGALLVLTVSELIAAPRPVTAFGRLPALSGRIHPDAVAKLAEAVKIKVPVLADGTVNLATSEAMVKFDVQVTAERKDMPNVVGVYEGSDPVLKSEYVGIGAHLDHLGRRGDVVYWGADDDASGCTALLGVAKALQANAVKPKRSILFMAFAGEESGLVGSRYLVDHPMFPIDKMICELQMDMVGRNSDGIQNGDRNRVDKAEENVDTMRLVGSKRISTELHELILDLNQYVNFRFKYDSEDVYTRSDHYAFAAKGIPAAFLFCGFHPDYHQPTDTPDKINYEKVTNAAKLFYLTALQSANRERPFTKDVSGG
jgi:hypothetical protein